MFQDVKTLTRLEKEIYKEPKETDTYRVVINVAGYVYNFLSPEVRYNSVKLMSRFADVSLYINLLFIYHFDI